MSELPFAVRRAGARYRTDQPGITTWHCFSSGSHYDPDNISFGPLITCDEHLVSAGAGFAPHRHVGVVIVSWPLSGALRHQGVDSAANLVRPGSAQILHAGAGVEHGESAAAGPARFIQLALIAELGDPAGYETVVVDPDRPVRDALAPIVTVATSDGPASVSVLRASSAPTRWEAGARRFVFVASGTASLTVHADDFLARDTVSLASGDSVRLEARAELELTSEPGPAELLVITLP